MYGEESKEWEKNTDEEKKIRKSEINFIILWLLMFHFPDSWWEFLILTEISKIQLIKNKPQQISSVEIKSLISIMGEF